VHVAFAARSRDEVDAFHAAAIAAGGTDNGASGPRDYGPYAAYVLDPDGTNLEAAFRS
jgi:predicted lactoylglutathione lyase